MIIPVFILIMASLQFSSTNLMMRNNLIRAEQAYLLAQTGINDCRKRINDLTFSAVGESYYFLSIENENLIYSAVRPSQKYYTEVYIRETSSYPVKVYQITSTSNFCDFRYEADYTLTL